MDQISTQQLGNSAALSLGAFSMAVSFSRVPANNPARKGELAARKQFFGDNSRYAVAPIHTRFDEIEWFVWDAEHSNSSLQRAEVIRQADTLEEAMEGLE